MAAVPRSRRITVEEAYRAKLSAVEGRPAEIDARVRAAVQGTVRGAGTMTSDRTAPAAPPDAPSGPSVPQRAATAGAPEDRTRTVIAGSTHGTASDAARRAEPPITVPGPRPEVRPPARPRIEPEPAILGLSRHTRSRLGSRLFNLFFVLVFTLIVVQMIVALLTP